MYLTGLGKIDSRIPNMGLELTGSTYLLKYT